MRLWIAIGVGAVALAACTSVGSAGSEVSTESEVQGNVALFCRAWPDARTTILGAVSWTTSFDLLGDRSVGLDRNFVDSDAALADVDRTVPADVRAEWDRAYEAYARVSDLLFVTGFTDGAIRPVHVTMAFGDRGPEGVFSDAEAAVAAIDDWEIEACGDFSSRWPEFESVLRYEAEIDWGTWQQNLDRYESSLQIGARLVPDEIRDYWEIAADIQTRRFVMFRGNGFQLHDIDEETALREWGVLPGEEAKAASDAALDRIGRWVEANSEPGAITTGEPGSVSIRMVPHELLTTRTVFAALLPAGTDFATVRNTDPYLAATCTGTNETPEQWERVLEEAARQAAGTGMTPEAFAREHWAPVYPLEPPTDYGNEDRESVCPRRGEGKEAILPGGAYELFVGAYIGEPGNYRVYFAAPEYCAQFPVTVNGDTVIDLPELEPCDLDPIGRAEEIDRRTLPPFEPGGTLRVEVDGAIMPEGFDHCGLSAALLPAGTTLNDVGIGDAWPNGVFSLWRQNPEYIGGGDEQRWAEAPGLVPILPAPPSGTGEVWLQAHIQGDGPWDTFFPDPVPLASGFYDLRVEEGCSREGEDFETLWCGSVAVEVKGDTVVGMPELEDCSWPQE
ncbi:MAG: hypothetical protein BMS9Abin12_1652 [Acidimicrobiia bacterium]|nr:MAG: hypothetical protein BMS9Abin12_1652 [Acidimicrobiia bacterium]